MPIGSFLWLIGAYCFGADIIRIVQRNFNLLERLYKGIDGTHCMLGTRVTDPVNRVGFLSTKSNTMIPRSREVVCSLS